MQDPQLTLPSSSTQDDDSSVGEESRAFDQSTSAYERSSVSERTDEAEIQYFGQRETRSVRNLKGLVFLVLFLVTLAVCLVIFFLTTKGEQAEFQAS